MKLILRPEMVAPPSAAPHASYVYNLLNDFETLRGWLLVEAEGAANAARPDDGADDEAARVQRRDAHVLDAYLVACGMNQILEDYLHLDVLSLSKVAKHLGPVRPPVGHAAAASVTLAGDTLQRGREQTPIIRRLVAQQVRLANLVQRFADHVAAQAVATERADLASAPDAHTQWRVLADLADEARALVDALRDLPEGLARSMLRLPSCFRSFDQHPADCYLIAQRFVERWPRRETPLLVVGVRTSGSYLAPLYAAFLRAMGYEQARAITLRPGRRWLAHERDALRQIASQQGRVLVADDPPTSGGSVAKAARQVAACGIPTDSITLLMPLFGARDTLPAVLESYDTIALPFDEWTVHQRIGEAAVRDTLDHLLRGRTLTATDDDARQREIVVESVAEVTRLPLALPLHDLTALPHLRSHMRALFRVRCVDGMTGWSFVHDVYVKGAGLGYFGAHAEALARALPNYHPQTFAVRDGLLYRSWLDEAGRIPAGVTTLSEREVHVFADRIASYVAQRAELLSVPEELAARLGGRDPLWQRAGDLIGQGFGRAALIFRPALHGLARTLLLRDVAHPCVVDGSMSPAQWFVPSASLGGSPAGVTHAVKVDYDERAFSNRDMYSYDPAFDLAAAAAHFERLSGGDAMAGVAMRARYTALTGESVSEERWLVHQLVSLYMEWFYVSWAFAVGGEQLLTKWSQDDDRPGERTSERTSERTGTALTPRTARMREETGAAMRHTMARAHMHYYGEQYFRDLTPPSSGPLCAIDIDGVLEMGWLSFPAISPAGALALRALTRHGRRPVLVTGRSVAEVRERCAAYRLAGGVAEYGAVLYNHLTDETRVLLTPEQQTDLDALRAALRRMDGVFLDEGYRYTVRAYRVSEHGNRRGLTPELLDAALAALPDRNQVRAIPGHEQTDFMAAAVDKGSGVRALAAELGAAADRAGHPLALAVGDSVSDLAMFALAADAFAPANADEAVRAHHRADGRMEIMRQPYQAGLLEAVARYLGHQPARCDVCQPPRLSRDAALLLTAFAAQDHGKLGKFTQGLLLAGRLTAGWLRQRLAR